MEFFRCRRKAGEIEIKAARERAAICGRRGVEILALQRLLDERVDRIGGVVGGDRRTVGFLKGPEIGFALEFGVSELGGIERRY